MAMKLPVLDAERRVTGPRGYGDTNDYASLQESTEESAAEQVLRDATESTDKALPKYGIGGSSRGHPISHDFEICTCDT